MLRHRAERWLQILTGARGDDGGVTTSAAVMGPHLTEQAASRCDLAKLHEQRVKVAYAVVCRSLHSDAGRQSFSLHSWITLWTCRHAAAVTM